MWRQKVLRSSRGGVRAVAFGLAGLMALAAIPSRALLAQGRIAPPDSVGPEVRTEDSGIWFRSADGKRGARIGGYLDIDTRFFMSDSGDAQSNMFAIRRARLILDFNINPWFAVQLLPDFDKDGKVELQDAYADIGFGSRWWMRVGKMTPPMGQERWTLNSDQFFPERSLGSLVTPDRDVGVMLTGEMMRGHVETAFGVFNGGPDNVTNEGETNDSKDVAVRVTWRPLIRGKGKLAQGWGIGFNGTTGLEHGLTGNSQLPSYKTPGGLTWFAYKESTGALADGRRDRAGWFGYVHLGAFGANAEWTHEGADVRLGATHTRVASDGWSAVGDWVVTGEPSSQAGITPARAFDPEKGAWGAVQIVARVSAVTIGPAAFPAVASSTTAARRASALSAGANWYFTRNTKLQASLEHTTFELGALTGDRRAEDYGLLRLQLFF